MITSPKNPTIQRIQKLQRSRRARAEQRLYAIEGVRLVAEARDANRAPELLLYTEGIATEVHDLLDWSAACGCPAQQVSERAFSAASDTQNPQGILAVLPVDPIPVSAQPGFVLILDGLRDPGNLGTILRTAAAGGVDAVLLPPGGVDPYNPKVVRAGMGAHFRLPIWELAWDEIQGKCPSGRTYLADPRAEQVYTAATLLPPFALIVGGEAAGASRAAQTVQPEQIRIPMPGGMESLNAAAAAAILIFESLRQQGRV